MRGEKGTGLKFLVLDRGNVELGIPRDWTVAADPAGHMVLKDPRDECLLEVSYLRIPRGIGKDDLPAQEMLQAALAADRRAARHGPMAVVEKPSMRIAWAEYDYESKDPRQSDAMRPARGRWLLARNEHFQVLMTFYYWRDDEGWTVPAWGRITDTLQLGNNIPLGSPKDHWSLREPA